MTKRPTRVLVLAGLAALLLFVIGTLFAQLYTEALWFDQLGFAASWWKRMAVGAGLRLLTSAAGALIVLLSLSRVVRYLGPVQLRRRYGNLEIAEQVPRRVIHAGLAAVAVLAGWWLSALSFPPGSATDFLAWIHRGPWGIRDPVFERDVAFYVFSLPILRRGTAFLLLVFVWSAMLVAVGYALVGALRLRGGRLEIDALPRSHFAALAAAILVLSAARLWLSRYEMLTRGTGFSGITGYTDVNARLLARGVLAVSFLGAAAAIGVSAYRRRWVPAFAALASLPVVGMVVGLAYPSLVQRLRVVPNELERETPYLARNLEFTRMAFGIADTRKETLELADGGDGGRALAPYTVRQPLWDESPLQTAFNQVQPLRNYYHFPSVHFDRYGAPGQETPVAIAVREFRAGGLPEGAATWRTLHLNVDQVRGNGAVVTPAAEKTAEGNPVFWLRNAEPVQRSADAPPDVTMRDPAILFGETTTDWLILNDPGPSDGTAGIRLDSFVRLLAFAWRLGDGNLLFSGELTSDSRLLIRRGVWERVRTLAPFIAWSGEPHPVLLDGRIVWTLDGFSVSSEFPLARAFPLDGIGSSRYVRNTVKATVDAVTGAVRFYALDPEEPLLAAWARAFPGLILAPEEMPAGIRNHLIYPRRLLQLQARVLEEYHVDGPAAFFSGENAWQIPVEPGPTSAGREYVPILVLGSDDRGGASFQTVVPLIARGRQNMTALLAAENDADRYGRLTLRELPPESQVTGPRQVRTLIEQDPTISAQLTLWRQGGSDVELGRLRVLPMDGWILYVQPIFLLGSGGSIPQLQRVVASDGTIVAMGQTLGEATAGLARGEPAVAPPPAPSENGGGWAARALELFQDAGRRLQAADWSGFGRRWSELQALLERAARADSAR